MHDLRMPVRTEMPTSICRVSTADAVPQAWTGSWGSAAQPWAASRSRAARQPCN